MLTVICGPMFAEKSTTLYRHVSRAIRSKKRVDVVVPAMDTRSKGQIVTHSGLTLETLGVTPRVAVSSTHLVRSLPTPAPDLVVVEEAQFFDLDLPACLVKLVERGIHVVAAGLDLTSEGAPFGPMGHLMCLADRVEKLTAICACGAEATRTMCRVRKDGAVLVGGGGEYVPACLPCWAKRPR